MPVSIIIYLAVFHYMGDFLFQSYSMTKNKSVNLSDLTFHAVIYTATLSVGALLFIAASGDAVGLILFALSVFATHWVTDFLTSRAAKSLRQQPKAKAGNLRHVFLLTGLDQLIHLIQVVVFAKIFLLGGWEWAGVLKHLLG